MFVNFLAKLKSQLAHQLALAKSKLGELSKQFRSAQSRTSSTSPATTPAAFSGLTSLSSISDQLENLKDGQSLDRFYKAAVLAIAAYLLSDLLALGFEKFIPSAHVSPLANRRFSQSAALGPFDYDIIASRNLFSVEAPVSDPNQLDLESAPVPTSLPLELVGTVIFENPARSIAAIQDKDLARVFPLRPGDEMEGKIEMLEVEAKKAIFLNYSSRRKEFVELPDDGSPEITMSAPTRPNGKGITQVDENRFTVTRSEIESQMANFNVLITQARAIPEMRGGSMIGFKLTQIVPGSFYQKIGLKDNDVITAVNGEKITDAAKALSMMQELKNMSSLDLTVERGGKNVPINYDIR